MKRTVRSNECEVSNREEGLIFARFFPNTEITVEIALEFHNMVAYIAEGKYHGTVVDISGVSYMEKEAREELVNASTARGRTIAAAIIANTFTSKIIGNFFLSVNKPNFPVRLFDDALIAQQWVRSEYSKAIAQTSVQ